MGSPDQGNRIEAEAAGQPCRSGACRLAAVAISAVLLLVMVGAVSGPAAAKTGQPAWKLAPVVPALKGKVGKRLIHNVEAGRRKGTRARVFAKVGDSNTEMVQDFYGLGCAEPRLGGRHSLKKVIARYRQVPVENERAMPGCEPWNSFSRRSAAAKSGAITYYFEARVADLDDSGYLARPTDCRWEETPLGCELRKLHPRYVHVMTGSNDVGFETVVGARTGSEIDRRLPKMIRTIRASGAVPVLSTIPPITSTRPSWLKVKILNRKIWRISRQTKSPMINLWRALTAPGTVNSGLGNDHLHLSVFGAGGVNPGLVPGPTTYRDSVDFRPEALAYGANLRNLIWLKTLRRLDRTVRRGKVGS